MGGDALIIRRFAAGEGAVWRDIRLDALRDAPAAFGETLEDAEKRPLDFYEASVSGPFPPFAALKSGHFVGTAGFHILSSPKTAHRGILWGMYVSPECRGQGVGRALIAAIIGHAQGRVAQIHLNVVVSNTAAYSLYRGMGFQTYGVEPRALRFEGRDYDEALMVRVLDAALPAVHKRPAASA